MITVLLAPASCVAGPAEPSGSDQLRPTPTFRCMLTGAEMAARVSALFATPAEKVAVTTLQRLLSLPPLPTQFDDTRSLNYVVQVTGPDKWSLRIGADEVFWPGTGRPEFAGPPYPRRLRPSQRGEIRLDIITLQPLMLGPGRCFSAAEVDRRLLRAGWKMRWSEPAMDSFTIEPIYTRGRQLSASLGGFARSALAPQPEDFARACQWRLTLQRTAA
jgi:hypothetical protein